MTTIDDLLYRDNAYDHAVVSPEMDPFTQDDALQEAQLLDVRFDALSGAVGILFELRQALELQQADTGVLIAHGTRHLAWNGPLRDTPLSAWPVGSSRPRVKRGLLGFSLNMWPAPGASLTLTAERAAFLVVQVRGIGDSLPPDYGDFDGASVRQFVAAWSSEIAVVSATRFGPQQPKWPQRARHPDRRP